MSRIYHLTQEQLDFISFLQREVASHAELKDRFKSCMSNLANEKTKTIDLVPGNIFHHSPQAMIKFLSLFSRDDRFKWYTHKWDTSTTFNIDEFIEQQRVTKYVLSDMAYPKESGPIVNEKTYNQVWNFINFSNTGQKTFPWKNTKFENIRCGWHSIIGLNNDKSDVPAENLILCDGHQFKDYIRMFKAIIEFRTDLNDDDRFSELVWNTITSILPKDFDVTFSSDFDDIGYDLNVYCDVVGFLSAIHTICNWIVRHKALSSIVRIDLINEKDYYTLEILHEGSYFNNIEKLKNPSGDLDGLRKRLFSVCDFMLEGDLKEDGSNKGSVIVYALDEHTMANNNNLSPCDIVTANNQMGGVKYNLKIFKR